MEQRPRHFFGFSKTLKNYSKLDYLKLRRSTADFPRLRSQPNDLPLRPPIEAEANNMTSFRVKTEIKNSIFSSNNND